MLRIVSTVLFLAAVGSPCFGASHPTPEETRAEFEALCARMRDGDNGYFGQQIVSDLRQRIEDSRDDILVASFLRGRLAWELIRLGQHEEAIEASETALAALRGSSLEADPQLQGRLTRSLALAHLQLAEDQNCVLNHSAAACILPIRADAVHQLTDHTRAAGDLFLELLRANPEDVQARWLLNLARMLSGEFPDGVPPAYRLDPSLLADESAFDPWINHAPGLGIDPFDLAGGAVIDDFDDDGFLDIVSTTWNPCAPAKAFRNDRQGGFEDVSEAWGLTSQFGGLNLVHADFDNDGHLDLLILRGAWMGSDGRTRNSLLKNDLHGESGRFVDVTFAAGLAYPAYPTQTAAWADFDLDGDLDLYVGNEATASSTNPLQLFGKTGNPYPSQLFRNNADGTFTEIGRPAGVTNRSFAKGTTWGDYDGDGDPDLYVSNLGPNRLYRNNGDSTFTDVAEELGVTEPAEGSFPTWFFDYDNDGDADLFVADYSAPVQNISAAYLGTSAATKGSPRLYRNDGATFTDVSVASGFTRPLLPMGANYGDLDNDGWLDLYLGTGVPDFDALMPNVMYRNTGGTAFEDVTFSGGFGHLQKGHGVAFGDLDNDGEQEIYHQLGGAYPFDEFSNALYDRPRSDHRWVVLRFEGREANRRGVGAQVALRVAGAEGARSIFRTVGSGGSFGGASLQQEIGLGEAERIEELRIRWPGDRNEQVFSDVAVNQFYRVVQGATSLETLDFGPLEWKEADGAPEHTHGASR